MTRQPNEVELIDVIDASGRRRLPIHEVIESGVAAHTVIPMSPMSPMPIPASYGQEPS